MMLFGVIERSKSRTRWQVQVLHPCTQKASPSLVQLINIQPTTERHWVQSGVLHSNFEKKYANEDSSTIPNTCVWHVGWMFYQLNQYKLAF